MTIYGAPIRRKNDEMQAIYTALEMVADLPTINAKHPELEKALEIGIGIHTGEVIIGNIGSSKRLDYTAIGDNVNLASSIDSLTKFYMCKIIISETTLQSVSQTTEFKKLIIREIDTVLVKGRSSSIVLFEIMGLISNKNSEKAIELKSTFESGLSLYKLKKFQEAKRVFESTTEDFISNIYVKRCDEFIENPPLDTWNGIYTMKEK